MKTVNFTKFPVYVFIDKKVKDVIDIKSLVSNLIYTRAQGIEAHSLAFKIYNAEGDIELNDGEIDIILSVVQTCSPILQDSLKDSFEL